jgi:hypothetical protein
MTRMTSLPVEMLRPKTKRLQIKNSLRLSNAKFKTWRDNIESYSKRKN